MAEGRLAVVDTAPPTAEPRWLVLVEAPATVERPQYAFAYAYRLPDLMALLGEWAPVLRDLAAVELSAARLLLETEDDFEDDPDNPGSAAGSGDGRCSSTSMTTLTG